MEWWGINGCVPKSVAELAHGWVYMCPWRNSKRAWTTLFFAIVWTIWEARNRKIFKDEESVMSVARDSIQFRVAWWFKHHGYGSNNPVTSLIQNISQRCKDPLKFKRQASAAWIPPGVGTIKFNVDGSAKVSLDWQEYGGFCGIAVEKRYVCSHYL